ncbi:MAG: ABC transporter permease [Chitinophagaceae bacterium]|nr:ABC transporter permease [Chitinophagaceae bacterium]
MLNNLSFTLRRFNRQKLNTSLHVVGLTLGITACLLIGLFIRYEISFDKYHSKADRIYRVNQIWVDNGVKDFHYSTPFPLADQIRKDIAGLEHVTKVHHPFQCVVEVTAEKRFLETHVIMTDVEFPNVFNIEPVRGDVYAALRKPYTAILTESTAKKYYGNENPIGKVFLFKDKFNVTVAAVIKDMPGNTHLPTSLILSFSDDEKYLGTSQTHYGSVSGGSTFIVLKEGVQPNRALTAGLQGIYDRTVNKEKWMPATSHCELEIQALSNVHFNAKYAGGGEWVKAVNTTWLWFFGSVGIAVLLLACINFLNLSTAQALTRAKEVGVRKSIGAGQFQLIRQFLFEALLLVFISAFLGIIITSLSLPYINDLVEKDIRFDIFKSPFVLGSLLIGILVTALLAGIYPAWIITKFRPATTMKSISIKTGSTQSGLLRKGLVITQFTISVALLIGLLLIGKQMDFFRNRNLGFDKENTVIVKVPDNGKLEVFKNKLQNIQSISSVAFSTSPPTGDDRAHWGTVMSTKGRDDPDRKPVTMLIADDKYTQLYGIDLKAGRLLTPADTNSESELIPEAQRISKVLINAKAVEALGFNSSQAALGQKFWFGMNSGNAEIVGVIENFNAGSLREEIKPLLLTQYQPFYDKANIKIKSGADIAKTLALIESSWKTSFPKGIYDFNFLDQTIDNLYKGESRLYSLFKIFSILAMLISCLGLWGLVAFAAEQRVKEIGIRKVLGASVPNIVGLLTRDFILLVSVSILIASPLAYWGMHEWLKEFAFQVSIGWTVFVIAAAVALIIAVATVSIQAIKAAISNPVKSLRSE